MINKRCPTEFLPFCVVVGAAVESEPFGDGSIWLCLFVKSLLRMSETESDFPVWLNLILAVGGDLCLAVGHH